MRGSTGSLRRAVVCVRVLGAILLGLLAGELALRALGIPRKHDREHSCDNEMSVPDERLGWVWRAEYTRAVLQGGRQVPFAFDREHDRARDASFVEDLDAPTVLLVGESIVAGHGLRWEETLPALVAGALPVQVIDLGVDGYGSDQAFLRLYDALPRFRNVVAVVTLFFPALAERVSWRDRPRLSFAGGVPSVAPPHVGLWEDLRVTRLMRALAPLEADAVTLTARIFLETARLAGERGACALFVTPRFPPGWPRGGEQLVDALLVAPGLAVIDPPWAYEPLPNDKHPNAASERRLADALVAALGSRCPTSRGSERE